MGKKTKIIFISTLTVVGLLMSSCASFSGVNPGTSNPVKADFEVLGYVNKKFKSHVLFSFTWGDNRLDAIDQLREKAAKDLGADDVINISVEDNILFIGGVYIRKKFILQGQAIKYN